MLARFGVQTSLITWFFGAVFLFTSTHVWADEDSILVQPPRTITDIIALLDEQKPDPAVRKRILKKLSAQPPATADPNELAKFYFGRGMARAQLGFSPRQLEDFRQAFHYVKSGKIASRRFKQAVDRQLAIAKVTFGNTITAISVLKKSLEEFEGAGTYSRLVHFSAKIGDLRAAEQWAKRGERFVKGRRARRGSWNQYFFRRWTASLLYARGKWAEAESYYRQALRALSRVEGLQRYPAVPFWTRRWIVESLTRQGRLLDAEVAARDLLRDGLKEFGKSSGVVVATVTDLAEILGEQGRYDDANVLLRAAVSISKDMGVSEDSVLMATARRRLGIVLAVQGNWAEAAEQFEFARKGLVENRILYQKWFVNDVTFALTAMKTGRLDDALAGARGAHEDLLDKLGAEHYLTAEAAGVLGMTLEAGGKREEALTFFRQAVPILLSRSRQSEAESGGPASQDMRRRLILESYISLLSDVRSTPLETKAGVDAVAEAFRLADVARGSSVQRALTASSVRSSARDPALADIVRREQDMLKQIRAYNTLLVDHLSVPTEQQNPAVLSELRTRIDELRSEWTRLAEQIEAQFPEYANLLNPQAPTLADIKATLRPNEALIATYVAEDRTFVWAVPHAGEVAFATVNLGRSEIETMVGLIRSTLNPSGGALEFELETAHQLYAKLLQPVRSGWWSATSLVVVAHGALGYLPFTVLPTAPVKLRQSSETRFAEYKTVPWLARTHAIMTVPTVASMKTLWTTSVRQTERRPFAGFGNPYFSREQADRTNQQVPRTLQIAGLSGDINLSLQWRALPNTEQLDKAQLARLPSLPETAEEIR